jgi:DnaJ-class molecular chaperone
MKDYYKTLEVGKECEKEDIKKSYRKMALKYHPDKNNGDDSKFKELSEAYEILSDDNKRIQYDYNCSHGVNYSTFGHQFMNPNDLFKEIFKNSDMDMMMSGFMNPPVHQNNVSFDNMMNGFLSPDFVFNNTSNSISSSTIIHNGKKVVATTIVENGVTRTEEKVYDFSINDA